jgi:cell division septum initiation protein DivIVA
MTQEGIDLKEVAELISALERDLAKVSTGSADVQALRDEVETLRNVLNSPQARKSRVRDALHGIRAAMEHAAETVAGEAIRDWPYLAEIGRILGMR